MTHTEAMKQGLGALEVEDMACRYEKEATPEYIAKAITALRQAIAEAEKENALQALHTENERLGLYKDAYGKPKQCTYPNCPYPCMDLPDCIEQEPVAHLWQHGETGRTRVTFPDSIADCDASWFCVGPLVLGNTHPPQRTKQEQSFPSAMQTVIKAIKSDPDYAWVWHFNIAMAFVDAGGDSYTGNQGAARFMKLLANVEPAYELPAQPEQEPVIDKSAAIRIATALGWEPKREWVGLTQDEFRDFASTLDYGPGGIIRAIEAKLKEKNT